MSRREKFIAWLRGLEAQAVATAAMDRAAAPDSIIPAYSLGEASAYRYLATMLAHGIGPRDDIELAPGSVRQWQRQMDRRSP